MRKLINFLFSDNQYDWMMNNLPFRLMYHHVYIDSQHKMWLPRWGWSKIQLKKAKERADKLYSNINFK